MGLPLAAGAATLNMDAVGWSIAPASAQSWPVVGINTVTARIREARSEKRLIGVTMQSSLFALPFTSHKRA